ncbi:peroxiredoxin [Alkalisalibacterium limincola]|uniref:thioredoxin-dependent peroxiredoxin n=1 Tax=Alkalisalibacterium limincola TaxID=2699169 RepID=A0A5C8KPJ0_9GAMM|nr:peroxiredoxin [Alkalisalibacterium limincola]TXK62074.1 peroxiredoxin [Alkalisalibacterium limincola]
MAQSPKRVPDLEFTLGTGETRSFADYAGKWLVLYFYPKDSTPGCTKESVAFSEMLPQFKRAGANILGASRDSQRSHQNFTEKQGLKFDLVSDTDEAVCNAFGVIQEKTLYGRKYMGIVRSTFLIDPDGNIRETWQPVKVPGHAEAVLDALKQHKKAQ